MKITRPDIIVTDPDGEYLTRVASYKNARSRE
jgi:hypothetical protein